MPTEGEEVEKADAEAEAIFEAREAMAAEEEARQKGEGERAPAVESLLPQQQAEAVPAQQEDHAENREQQPVQQEHHAEEPLAADAADGSHALAERVAGSDMSPGALKLSLPTGRAAPDLPAEEVTRGAAERAVHEDPIDEAGARGGGEGSRGHPAALAAADGAGAAAGGGGEGADDEWSEERLREATGVHSAADDGGGGGGEHARRIGAGGAGRDARLPEHFGRGVLVHEAERAAFNDPPSPAPAPHALAQGGGGLASAASRAAFREAEDGGGGGGGGGGGCTDGATDPEMCKRFVEAGRCRVDLNLP